MGGTRGRKFVAMYTCAAGGAVGGGGRSPRQRRRARPGYQECADAAPTHARLHVVVHAGVRREHRHPDQRRCRRVRVRLLGLAARRLRLAGLAALGGLGGAAGGGREAGGGAGLEGDRRGRMCGMVQ
eukprot:GO256465.1.p2 GENE.GO256465.1~~GO256465.1.p2  ORF type:complete len:127 (-),score=16.35 GO256465.1:14-394(-)